MVAAITFQSGDQGGDISWTRILEKQGFGAFGVTKFELRRVQSLTREAFK